METADVRRRVAETIERARRGAAERREQTAEETKTVEAFREIAAVPLFRQVANVLKLHRYPFSVFTPGGSVRLSSDKSADDYIEIALDTAGAAPAVMLHTRVGRGRRVVES